MLHKIFLKEFFDSYGKRPAGRIADFPAGSSDVPKLPFEPVPSHVARPII
jgi:hypothetical protein